MSLRESQPAIPDFNPFKQSTCQSSMNDVASEDLEENENENENMQFDKQNLYFKGEARNRKQTVMATSSN